MFIKLGCLSQCVSRWVAYLSLSVYLLTLYLSLCQTWVLILTIKSMFCPYLQPPAHFGRIYLLKKLAAAAVTNIHYFNTSLSASYSKMMFLGFNQVYY
jgi:hypothetical protein